MYKVYFNDRLIEINVLLTKHEEGNGIRVCSYPGCDLKKEWKSFVKTETIKKLYISGKEDVILSEIMSMFKLIVAAGGLVKNKKGECLLIFRNGKWDLPKGKLEKKETIENCAMREVEEECGITGLKILNRLPDTYHIYELKGAYVLKNSHWFMMTYTGNQKPVPQTNEGITMAEWVKEKNVEKLKDDMYPSIKGLLEQI